MHTKIICKEGRFVTNMYEPPHIGWTEIVSITAIGEVMDTLVAGGPNGT